MSAGSFAVGARNRSTGANPSSSNLRGRGRSHSLCVFPMSLMNGSKSHGVPCQAKMAPANLLGCSARRCKMRSDTSTPAGQIVRQDLQLTQASTTRLEFEYSYPGAVTISYQPRELISSD